MVHNIITRGELKTIGIMSEDMRTWGWCLVTLQETGDLIVNTLIASAGSEAPLTFPGQFRNAMCHKPSLVSLPTSGAPVVFKYLQFMSSPQRDIMAFPGSLLSQESSYTQKIQRLDYFSTFYLIMLSKTYFLSLINVWIRRMRAAGRAGGSVCLIRYCRCYRSSVCDTHSTLGTRDDGMAR